MPKFNAKIQRDFELEIEADDLATAERITRGVIAQFPPDTAKVLYIVPEGVVAVPTEPDGTPTPPRPFGRPNGGGSPGTPVVKQEVLVDQIADRKVA